MCHVPRPKDGESGGTDDRRYKSTVFCLLSSKSRLQDNAVETSLRLKMSTTTTTASPLSTAMDALRLPSSSRDSRRAAMPEQPAIPVVPPAIQAVPAGSTGIQLLQPTDVDDVEEPMVEGMGQYFNKQTMTYFAAGGF